MVVTEKIERYYELKEGNSTRDMSKLHVSNTRKCPREVYFKFKGYESDKVGSRIMRLFDNGDSYHQRMMKALYESGIEIVSAETNIPENDLVQGRCDCIISLDGENFVLDFKSASSTSFYYIQQGQEKDVYVSQLNLYMHFLGIKKGILLYENKDTQELYEKVYDYDPKRAEKDLKDLKDLDNCIKETKVPEVPDEDFLQFGKSDKKICDYCSYREVCDAEEKN